MGELSLPRRVAVLGGSCRVEIVLADELDDGKCLGTVDIDRDVIKISDGCSERAALRTLLHEVLHLGLNRAGSKRWDDETLLLQLETVVTDFLLHNPEIARRIAEIAEADRVRY